MDPYMEALELVQIHHGTSGQAALAKCILSLYNSDHAFSISEILAPLDQHYTSVVFAMLHEYSAFGETEELRIAGQYVYENFPSLIELSNAMHEARSEVYRAWSERREEEMRRLYPDE